MITQETIIAALHGYAPRPISTNRDFSVLIPLVEKNGVPHILFEVRADELDVQPGEISFPGGAIEEGETKQEAAVRETVEELGVVQSDINVLAELNYLVTYSNLTVYCFLGSIPCRAIETSTINRAEVKETFMVPLSFFLETEPVRYINRIIIEPDPGMPYEKISPSGEYAWHTGTNNVFIYTWSEPNTGKERIIWGMTAKLIYDFMQLIGRQI